MFYFQDFQHVKQIKFHWCAFQQTQVKAGAALLGTLNNIESGMFLIIFTAISEWHIATKTVSFLIFQCYFLGTIINPALTPLCLTESLCVLCENIFTVPRWLKMVLSVIK